ncbi:Tim44 domain-containing protein [Paludibacterium paludis]|uniref:Transporter n=1 Tax=Paludibacterium paludis TaxID=1225769 RepID=A0A918U9X6_9NEIS|nr:Tim44-like domain-containing protein [Paludibacterium paludis]GGY15245.1 transporter [Paludibacterium paludis]
MTSRAKTILLAFSMVSLVAVQTAEAGRIGGGRSSGMRRSAPAQSYQRQSPPPQQANPQYQAPAPQAPAAQPQKKGIGVGTAVAAGVAGAAVGYMAGKAMNDNHAAPQGQAQTQAPAPVDQQQGTANDSWGQPARPASSGTPWGLILILGGLLAAGLFWFRRRVAPPAPAQAPADAMARANTAAPTGYDAVPRIGSGLGAAAYPGTAPTRLSDGTETPNFLRQAKATFLHLQSLNSPDSLEEVRRYMTPDLFEAIRSDIAGNTEVADFPQLDCQLIETNEEYGGRHVASVRFSGTVSETVNAPAVPFTETWHYIKDPSTNGKWLVAGIQQD